MKIKIPTPASTMRHLILPLLAAGVVAGAAQAASGVRIHRLGDPPLPPRYLDTKTSSQYKKRPSSPDQLVKPVPAPRSTALADPSAHAKRLPLAPEGFKPTEAQPAAAPVVRTRRLPLAPEQPKPSVSIPAPAPQKVVVPEPKPVVIPTPAPATRPALTPPVVPKPMMAAPAPEVKPAAPAAPAVKQRRRLPIAPVVADGSADLPPVPSALITTH